MLHIAHLLLQLLEKGSLLRQLAQARGKETAVELFGSVKNMARRLLEQPCATGTGRTRRSTRRRRAGSRSG